MKINPDNISEPHIHIRWLRDPNFQPKKKKSFWMRLTEHWRRKQIRKQILELEQECYLLNFESKKQHEKKQVEFPFFSIYSILI